MSGVLQSVAEHTASDRRFSSYTAANKLLDQQQEMEDHWKLRASLKSSTTQAAQAANHVPTNALNQVCVFPTVLA